MDKYPIIDKVKEQWEIERNISKLNTDFNNKKNYKIKEIFISLLSIFKSYFTG